MTAPTSPDPDPPTTPTGTWSNRLRRQIGALAGGATSGFRLAGMRERVTLSAEITPAASGTTVRAVIPLPDGDETAGDDVAREIGG